MEEKPKRILTAEQKEAMKQGRIQVKKRKEEEAAKKAAKKAAKQTAKAPVLTNMPLKINESEVDDEATASWRPARITDIPEAFKLPEREYHFFLDNANSIRKRQMERWHVDTEIAALMAERYGARTLAQGTTLDGCYRVNELILMWMPKKVAASRTKYYQDMAMDAGDPKRIIKEQIGKNSPDSRPDESQVYTRHPAGGPDLNKIERISAADLPT